MRLCCGWWLRQQRAVFPELIPPAEAQQKGRLDSAHSPSRCRRFHWFVCCCWTESCLWYWSITGKFNSADVAGTLLYEGFICSYGILPVVFNKDAVPGLILWASKNNHQKSTFFLHTGGAKIQCKAAAQKKLNDQKHSDGSKELKIDVGLFVCCLAQTLCLLDCCSALNDGGDKNGHIFIPALLRMYNRVLHSKYLKIMYITDITVRLG